MNPRRAGSMGVAGRMLPLPCFFPSISSVKTNLRPVDYLDVLMAAGHPSFLFSAYDVAKASREHSERIDGLLRQAAAAGPVVLMDSGNYEAFWKGDWAWTATALHAVLTGVSPHLCFCYDNQTPPPSATAIAEDVVASVLRDQSMTSAGVIPIVHGTADLLPEAIRLVAEQLYPPMIAVPERALGDGILARAATVRRVRAALDDLGVYVPLHLLGTGNPVSLLVYALAGADSFDGLEWCQTVVDHRNGRPHHFQHWDFFVDQAPLARDSGLPYIQSVLLHNLAFYTQFMTDLAQALGAGQGAVFAHRWLPADEFDRVAMVLEGKLT